MTYSSITDLPNNIDEIKRICMDAFQAIEKLNRDLAWFQRQMFGRRADFAPPSAEVLDLFAPSEIEPAVLVPTETVTYERAKKGHGRTKLPVSLPRIMEILDVPEEEKICQAIGCGCAKTKIGVDISEVLELVPQKYFVIQYHRPKYACAKHAELGITQAKPAARFIPKGIAGEGLLANILLEKFVNHQPLSRQETGFRRQGLSISVSTMVGWMETATAKLKPIVSAMQNNIIAGKYAYSDDTPLPVLQESKGLGAHRGFMWVYSNGQDAVVFEYTPGRGKAGPTEFLEGFSGFLHSDAYAGYSNLHVTRDVQPVYCWAHARRRFVTAVEPGGKALGDERARRPLQLINRLFRVDRYAREKGLSKAQLFTIRLRVSARIIVQLERCLNTLGPAVLPKSSLGDAIGYYNRHREGFSNFLKDGALSLDNNLSERQIRQVVIGRKNYHFCGSDAGAKRAAILYSIVGTCKMIGLDPWKYLAVVFNALAKNPSADANALTPVAIKTAMALGLENG